jgi:hypothetical protein
MDGDLIDRVAKVIQDGVLSGVSDWRLIAHDVLVEMREPTAAMAVAAPDCKAHYQAMIDAELRHSGGPHLIIPNLAAPQPVDSATLLDAAAIAVGKASDPHFHGGKWNMDPDNRERLRAIAGCAINAARCGEPLQASRAPTKFSFHEPRCAFLINTQDYQGPPPPNQTWG